MSPKPWISLAVVVPKPNGDIGLCVDMRQVNSAIVREDTPSLQSVKSYMT